MILTEQIIRDCLPVPPFSHKYLIIQQSPQIWRVDLLHPMKYSYTTDPVKTIWGFVKSTGKVHSPLNHLKPRQRPLCDLTEVTDDLQWTTIIPKTRSILHL